SALVVSFTTVSLTETASVLGALILNGPGMMSG
ncbi:MAG: hypothetical protein K0S92_1349, partial [Desertimonas sp.]|nr:hypothetical protein [Desertimonas sp.]